MAFALLTPIAIEVAKSIGMGVVTTGLERLISGRNIFTGDGKHRRRKLKGGADPDPTMVKAIEDLTLQHLTGQGKTRKKRTRKLKGGNFGDDVDDFMNNHKLATIGIAPFYHAGKDVYNVLDNLASGKNIFTGRGRSGTGKSGGAKTTSPWIERVKEYRKKHGCSYKEALIKLGKSNKK